MSTPVRKARKTSHDQDMGRRPRVRLHVNPFKKHYQVPINIPVWEAVYANPEAPLLLDLGSARGRFLYHMAHLQPERNFLGIEIRRALVEEANTWRDRAGLSNLHYLFGNVQTSLEDLLQSLPEGTLDTVTVLYPDPWFKKKHHKRRMIQPPVVDILARYLPPGGKVFLASDVREVAEYMRDQFLEHGAFEPTTNDWLEENPFPVASEREVASLRLGRPVYRLLLQRSSVNPHSLSSETSRESVSTSA